MQDWMLDEHIITAVSDAAALELPITVGRGPNFDKALKKQIAVRGVHQSVICAHLNHLVEGGQIRTEQVGTHMAYLGDRPKQYPVVEILPA